MVGGLILGILGQAANTVINTQASDWFPFVVVVVILLLLPEGLFSIRGTALRGLLRSVRRPSASAS
jgi:branched-chain amino acid transport system permease protein